MGRTVDICGVEMPTQSLGQPMDDAFDRLYKEFSEKGFLPVDDEFKTTASRYFDGFIGSVHAPAAHDHYFYCFLPIWNVLVSTGRPAWQSGYGNWLSNRFDSGSTLTQANRLTRGRSVISGDGLRS
jgi:hypothetical protein